MSRSRGEPPKENLATLSAGQNLLRAHPLFAHLTGPTWDVDRGGEPFAKGGFARLNTRARWRGRTGHANPVLTRIEINPWRRATAEEWAHVLGQALIHHFSCHADPARVDDAWQTACELTAAEFTLGLGVGRRPDDLIPAEQPGLGRDVETIAATLRDGGPALISRYRGWGLAGPGAPTFTFEPNLPPLSTRDRIERRETLAGAFRASVIKAVETAGDAARGPATPKRNLNSLAERARSWFVANYPLLAALAAAFDIVEDADLCARYEIAVAAVNSELRTVYVNPNFPWTSATMRFVMAHELLHVGLRHEARRQGRDPFLWNIACDYVINGWLMAMGVGEMPTDTLLLDPELELEKDSAEAVYDRIVGDLRLIRRLNKARTLRGQGKVDMLGGRPPAWWNGPGTDLDAFYRRALAEGLDIHLARTGRGLLPGDLVEEIRAIQQRPIPWDVRLGSGWTPSFRRSRRGAVSHGPAVARPRPRIFPAPSGFVPRTG